MLVPVQENGLPVMIINLDSTDIIQFLNGIDLNGQRADCLVVYREATAIIEIKASYPEKAIPQLRKTAELLSGNWDRFLALCGLPPSTPRPSSFYFCVEKGIGGSRYEVNNSGILVEKSRKGKSQGPVQKVMGAPIMVYTRVQIDGEYRLHGER